MSKSQGRPYTPKQREHLLGLLADGAISRETGKGPTADGTPWDAFARGLNPLVVGNLRDRGLADSRGIHRHGRAWTIYWLTELGAAEAARLRDGETTLHG